MTDAGERSHEAAAPDQPAAQREQAVPGTPAAPAERSAQETARQLATLFAPVTVLSALLYYFGYVREQAFFDYYGIDVEAVGLGATDYLVRSAGAVFRPLAISLVVTFLVILLRQLATGALEAASPARVRLVVGGLVAASAVCIGLGTAGLRAAWQVGPALLAPISLGVGALLAEQAAQTATSCLPLSDRTREALRRTHGSRRLLVAALLVVGSFWATAQIAQDRGVQAARVFESSLAVQPQVVIYSRLRLQLDGTGVVATALDARNAAYAFRYNGFRLLIHANARWFLVPAGWRHTNGQLVSILPDQAPAIRLGFLP